MGHSIQASMALTRKSPTLDTGTRGRSETHVETRPARDVARSAVEVQTGGCKGIFSCLFSCQSSLTGRCCVSLARMRSLLNSMRAWRAAVRPCAALFNSHSIPIQFWFQFLLCGCTTHSCSMRGDRQGLPKESIGSSTERLSRRERLKRRGGLGAARGAGRGHRVRGAPSHLSQKWETVYFTLLYSTLLYFCSLLY